MREGGNAVRFSGGKRRLDTIWGGFGASHLAIDVMSTHNKDKRNAIIAWIGFALITAGVVASSIFQAANRTDSIDVLFLVLLAAWGLVPITFALIGALIVSRQPRNGIGLLLMVPAISFALPVDGYLAQFSSAPPSPTFLLFAAIWLQNWGWLLLILPILFLLLLFPTGRPPTPRWRWLIFIGTGMAVAFASLVTFLQELGPIDAGWKVNLSLIHISEPTRRH